MYIGINTENLEKSVRISIDSLMMYRAPIGAKKDMNEERFNFQ